MIFTNPVGYTPQSYNMKVAMFYLVALYSFSIIVMIMIRIERKQRESKKELVINV